MEQPRARIASIFRKPLPKAWKRQLLKLPWLLLFPAALLLKEWASVHSGFVEGFYSRGVFPVISHIVGFLFGWMHFSVAELLLYAGVVAIPIYIVVQIILVLVRKDRLLRAFKVVVNLTLVWCVGYFLFIAMWGLNYYRQPLAVTLGYSVESGGYYMEDLTRLCAALAKDANEFRAQVKENANGRMELQESPRDALLKVPKAYDALAREFTGLKARHAQPKPVLLSHYLSYTNIEGIFIPFTMEPNVNVDMPESSLLSAACHEAAHAQGFAREDEANFLSYLACMASGDPELKYSGTLLALTTSMNALYSYDGDAYYRIARTYSPSVQLDLNYEYTYWKQFEGPVAETSGRVNDSYLKSNKQEDGTRSYGRMVDLLLAKMLSEQGYN
jgi:hypothetical protein